MPVQQETTPHHTAEFANIPLSRMRRAAIYCRISDDREGAGLGVARQEADCRERAERLGWVVAGLYVDNDLSAYSGRVRPEYDACSMIFGQMLRMR
jgi:hypothetical protein